ncbi:MAG TPA: TonB-dependent receptor [Bryobacteraceae bacterium]
MSGKIADSSGGALADASVTAINSETGIRRSTHSSANGEYAIGSLPAGNYKITARKPGFQTIARLDVRVSPGENTDVEFSMQVGHMREVITVLAVPSDMNSDDAATLTHVPSDASRDFPTTGRGILESTELAPGVIATPATQGEAGQFSVNGQRPNANYFSVDGVSANTGVSGSATPAQFSGGTLPSMTAFGSTATLAPEGSIDELYIQTSGFAPEFGHTPGAQLQIATRSGSNEFHGGLFALARSQTFDANDWFANRAGFARTPAVFFDGGGNVGGSVRRDHTFLFAEFEALRMDSAVAWESAVPSLASRISAPSRLRPLLADFPLPNGPVLAGGAGAFSASASQPARFEAGTVRIDHALTTRISLFARYQITPSSADSGFAQVDHSEFSNHSFTLGLATQASPNVVDDLRFNYTATSVRSSWRDTGAGGSQPFNLASFFPAPASGGPVLYGFAIGGIGQILSGSGSRSQQTQWQATDTLSWQHGRHAFRFGADSILLSPSRDQRASSIAGSYLSLSLLLANGPILLSQSQEAAASSRIETLALFAQDTWRLSPRLTLNYGLRWEITPAPIYDQADTASPPTIRPATWPTRYGQVAPRLGLAYRYNGATVLRAGWGIFYDAEFAAATDPMNAFPYNRWQFAVQSGALPLAPASGPSTGAQFAPNLQLPFASEWNLSLDHEFGSRDILTASYVGAEGRRLLRREAATDFANQVAVAPVATNNSRSDFEGLEIHYRRKLTAGWQWLASYTWSHAMDNGSWDSGVYQSLSAVSDRGPSAFDVRHNVSAGASWKRGRWMISSLIEARTGFPIDVLASDNILGLAFDDFPRPNLVAGVPVWIHNPSAPGDRSLDAAAFAVAPVGAQGNLGRNAIRGFGMAQIDLALEREFSVREGSISLRLEAFNALNHAQFADPVRFLNSPLFGFSASMLNAMLGGGTPHSGIAPAFEAGGPRVLQAQFRFQW